ncbi:Hypothetical predicted protein [Paramuricea clavata]|uniref:Uncharacterized protein n=1 Tax=Paramuricea clavata TaxID=317549 RepID=A0A7D9IKL1_PARCT|nr:Hypothetical predicted protein [Paramuricea clavata]
MFGERYVRVGNPGSSDIYVDTGAVIKCQSLTVYLKDGSNVFLNGTITCTTSFDSLNVRVISGNLHVSVSGILGQKVSKDNLSDKDIKKTNKKKNQHTNSFNGYPPSTLEQNSKIDPSYKQDAKTDSSDQHNTKAETNKLYLEMVEGNLTNFGRICAKKYLLLICDTLMLCEDSEYDTASRGFRSYTALQKESGFLSSICLQENPKQSSSSYDPRLLPTVRSLDSKRLISILNEEVDPMVEVDDCSIHTEFNNICREGNRATYDKEKVEKELIRGSLNTWKWKHGIISSTSIKCVVKQDINDCSQLQSKELALQVDGTARLAKPWTWKCGELSGFVKGDFLFHDNAVLSKFNKFCVVGNFRIFRTSSVCVKEGGELIIGEEFENNSVLISDKSLSLTLGYLKQAKESSIISNEDLLVALYKKIEDIWFGYIYADHHLFLQVQERVVCDASCVAKEVHLEFVGERPQFVVTQVLLAEEGSLNMWAENKHESANFLLSGKLNSHGIQAETASVCVLPGGVAELTCELNVNEVDVITRWLNISNQAVMISRSKENKESENMENYNLTTNVYCEESLVVDGALGAFGSDLSIYCEALRNNGVIKLSTIDRSSSLLHIECDKELFNSGTIGSEGNMTIDAMIVSNETGVIKSSPSLRISTNFLGATSLCGQILVDKQLFIHSKSEKELMLNVIGGKSEGERHFIPPDQLEVKCKKADLKIDSSIICPEINQQLSNENEGESSIMVLSLHKCLSLTKECKLEDVRVQFIQIEQEDNNNSEEPSKFVVLDSFKVKSLYLSSGNALESDVVRKGTVSFGGSNRSTVVDTLEVDEAIHEVIFGTENLFVCTDAVLDCEMATIKTALECLEVHANNVNVYGQMRCIGRSSEEKKCLVKVKNTFSLDGSVECAGSVEIFIGELFVQAEDGNIAVEGDLLLKIVNENGHLSLEGSTKGQKESIMKVESDNIKVSGCLSEIHTLGLNAKIDMALSEKSRISCEEINVKGEWITTAGTIDEFNKLSIQPWAIMNSGVIDSDNDSSNIFFQSDLTLINSGICRAQMTYLEAPFLLNLPGKVISDVNDVTCCQLVGKETLKLESIACFLGGSSLRSCKRYENLSVLLFKFLTYVACTPDSKSLEAWSKAAESLRNIQSQITPDASKQDSTKLKTLMNSKDIVTGTEVDLRIARMYDMVNDFVAEILKSGIKSFDATKLVHILTIESERYTKINILKEKLLRIPEKARAIRELIKKRAIKIKKSVRKKFAFSDPKMQSQQQDGIFESGFYSFGEGVTFTDSLYEAAFVEVFRDEGFLFAVDFLASSKDVVLSKREKKAVAMVIYSEKLNMENVDAIYAEVTADEAKLKNMKIKTLDVNARESVEAEKIMSDQLRIQGGKDLKATEVCAQNAVMTAKNIKLKGIKSTNFLDVQASKAVDVTDVQGSNVHVQAKEISATNVGANTVVLNATNNARLEDITFDNLNVKSSQTIVAESITGKSVHMESNNISVSKLDAKNTSLNAANNARLENIQSDNLQVQATETIDAENIKGENVRMESSNINVSTLNAKTTSLNAANNARLENIQSDNLQVQATETIDAENIKGENVHMESSNINVSTLNAKTTSLNAANNARLENIQSDNLQVQATETIDAENIKGENVHMESSNINVSTLNAKTTSLNAANNARLENIQSDNLRHKRQKQSMQKTCAGKMFTWKAVISMFRTLRKDYKPSMPNNARLENISLTTFTSTTETINAEKQRHLQALTAANNARLENIQSDNLQVQATETIDAENIKGENVHMESSNINLSTLNAKNTSLNAANNARLINIQSDNLQVQATETIDAENIKGENVHMESSNINVSTLNAKTTSLNAANSARLINIQSDNLQVQATETIDAENIKGEDVHMESSNINLSTLNAKNTSLNAANNARLINIQSDNLQVQATETINAENIKGENVHMESSNINLSTLNAKNTSLNAANSARLINIQSDNLQVQARETIDAENIKGENVHMESSNINVSTLDAKNTSLNAANNARLINIQSDNLQVQATETINAENIKGENVHMESSNINVSTLDAKTTSLNAANNARLENIQSDNLQVQARETIDAENIKGENVHMESSNINVSTLDAKNTSLNAANKARLQNIQSGNLQVQAKQRIDAENIKGNSVRMESRTIKASNVRSELAVLSGQQDVQVGDIKSKMALIKSSQGKVKVTGKIESENAKIESQNGVNLAYNKNGSLTADHQFKSLQMKTNKINEVNKLLKGDGIYKDLKISDQLGLVVSDQDVIFSRCVVQQNYKLDLNARSVNIDNASLNWSKGASITSDKTMKVNDSSITSQKSISLESKSGNVNMNLSEVKAGEIAKIEARKGSVSLSGTSISGDQAAIVKAKGDVIINPVVKCHSNSSSCSGFFSSSSQSSSHSTVTKSGISSSKGIVAVEAQEGKVQATATEFTAEKGVYVSAEKDIIFQDKITSREEVSVKKNWFRTKRSVHKTEESHKSLINSRGPVCMESKGNIHITATDNTVKADMFLEAAGTVLIQDRILSKSEERHTSGFSFSPGKGLSCGESNKQRHQQQLAGSKLQVGGNLVMKGKNVFAKNAMEMDTKNLVVNAENVKFEGAELNNSYSERSSSLNFGIMSVDITEEKGWEKEKKIINQNINVLGQINFINCKNVTLAASNLDTGAISGYVENLNVISKQTEVEAKKQTETLGFVVKGCLPVPSKYGASKSCDKRKFVEKSSGIHVRRSINNEFKVGTVYLKGSAVTANGDIAKFAENVISEKITSYRSQTTSGFNFGISKTSVEFGIHQSEKFMEMEHNATIGSISGTVANEVKQSVNTDLSKHSQITQMRNSNLGFNVKAGKDGCAASLQVGDIGVGFSASKHKIGVHGQVGDKGFSASAGLSGASLSLQNGKNSIGVGLTNQGVDMNIRSGDTAIGASLGKNAISATVQSKDVSLGASTSNGSFALKCGEYGFGLEKSKETSAAKSKYSANIKARNIEIEASSSKCQKTFGLTAGEYQTKFNKEKDAKTGKPKYDGNLKVGDVKVEASSSKDKTSFGLETSEFQTDLKKEKDSKTGKSKYDGNLKRGDVKFEASSSKDKTSFGLESPEFEIVLKKEKDSKTGKSKYDGNLKRGDVKFEASSSKDKTSFGLESPEFEIVLKKEKDLKTGKSKYDGNLKRGDVKFEASSSKDKTSFGLESPEFEIVLKKEKDSKTGKSKYDGNLKRGDVKVEASSSKDKTSFGLETSEFQTDLKKEKDSKTGKSKYDGNLKRGDVKVEASSSKDKTSFGLETSEFQTDLKKEKDSKTGKSKYDGNLKRGDVKVEASSSKDKKPFVLEMPEIQTEMNKIKETTSTYLETKGDGIACTSVQSLE